MNGVKISQAFVHHRPNRLHLTKNPLKKKQKQHNKKQPSDSETWELEVHTFSSGLISGALYGIFSIRF